MSDATDPSTKELMELRTELRRMKSAVRLAIAGAVGVAIATPLMIMLSVSQFVRPEWMQGQQTIPLLWAFLVLASFAVSWTSITLLRRRTARLP